MCKIHKGVAVDAIKAHLQRVIDQISDTQEEVKATLVEDPNYMTMTAVIGNKVLCINFMQ